MEMVRIHGDLWALVEGSRLVETIWAVARDKTCLQKIDGMQGQVGQAAMERRSPKKVSGALGGLRKACFRPGRRTRAGTV